MKSSDLKLDTRFFGLFKGDPGTGKSIAAVSFPKPYVFDNDRRMKSVVNFWRPRGKEFEYDHFDSYLLLNKRLQEFYDDCPFETLVYDSITTGSRQILRDMMSTRPQGQKKVQRGGIEMYQIEDYGGESRGLETIINNLKAISFRWGVNVIVTAHVLTTEQSNIKTGVASVSRSLLTAGKKVAAGLPVDFDEAYHFDVQTDMSSDGDPKYTVITKNVGADWAKTSLPLPIRIDFTGKSLYDLIIAELEGKAYIRCAPDPTEPKSEGGW